MALGNKKTETKARLNAKGRAYAMNAKKGGQGGRREAFSGKGAVYFSEKGGENPLWRMVPRIQTRPHKG